MQPVSRVVEKINWFPGHMYKATKLLKEHIRNIDVFLEIRDARVPHSSRNHDLDEIVREFDKPKIILFNKIDLCHQVQTNKAIIDLNKAKIHSMALSAQMGTNVNKIIQQAREIRPAKYNTVGMWMMVGGMPNVGKSTILNTLRNRSHTGDTKKNVAKTGPLPCVTRGVSGFKVNKDPLVYVVDTPGIMVPRIIDEEIGIKLALVGSIKDSIVGKDVLVNYLMDFLNKRKVNKYVKLFGLPGPITVSDEFVGYINDKYRHNNMEATYDYILGMFRKGNMGRVTLDEICMD